MEPSKFDELTKALVTATSRRQALKTIAATTLGSILGLSGIGTAFGKNKTCAQFCNAVFGANTPAAEQCTADAAHHTGLCYTCGPAAPAGHPPVCGQVCCSSGQVCLCNGTCATPCATPNEACPGGSLCNSDDGANYCGGFLESNPICTSDCDCPRGMFCATDIGTCAFAD